MGKPKHPVSGVLKFFQTQPKETCQLALQLIKDTMTSRFVQLVPPKKIVRRRGPNKPKVGAQNAPEATPQT